MTAEEKAKKIKDLVDHHQELLEAIKTMDIPRGLIMTVNNGLNTGLVSQIADVFKK